MIGSGPLGRPVNVETELKLLLKPEAMRRLRRHSLVQGLKQGHAATRRLKSVYFDTSDWRLRDHGVVLRVRHAGRRRIQTLKTMGNGHSGIATRPEWEAEIRGDRPELIALHAADGVLPDAADRLLRGLRPVFTTDFRRTTYRLGTPEWEVELALDEGELVADRGQAPIVEAELELKRGEPKILFDLARSLQKDVPARVSVASKAERGFALVDGVAPQPQKARAPALPSDSSAGDSFRAIARSCAAQLLANQDCLFETRDPEAVHQMRVALRRLGSAMRLFESFLDTPETAALSEEMRWLQSHLGPARDAEILITAVFDPLVEIFGREAGYRALREAFESRRQAVLDDALATLAAPRFTQFVLGLGAWIEGGDWLITDDPSRLALLDEPATIFAAALLDRLDRSARKSLRGLASLDEERRHRARIRVKRLRYAMEFFASLFPKRKAKRLVQTLARLQDHLGLLNDIAVAARLLRDHAEGARDPALILSAGKIIGWHAGRVPKLLAEADSERRAAEKLRRFWHDGK